MISTPSAILSASTAMSKSAGSSISVCSTASGAGASTAVSGFSCRYSSSRSSRGVTPASSFGITSVRRSIISPACCSARALADSNLRCSASCKAASAARLVRSHSSSTSSMVICPVIWRSSCACSSIIKLI